jgi:hypothetical protein
MSFRPGHYKISKGGISLKAYSAEHGSRVVSVFNESSTWKIETIDETRVVIKEKTTGLFLSYEDGAVDEPMLIISKDGPCEWEIRQNPHPERFHIAVPGGPFNGEELCVHISSMTLYPPQAALRPYSSTTDAKSWLLDFAG